MKTYINPLANFLKTNYQYKQESQVRLRRVYDNFIKILKKEDLYSDPYIFKQFPMDFDTLSNLYGEGSQISTKKRKRAWCAINLQ